MATSLQTEIEIAASPERVWAILTDFPAYPTWNPFIRRIAGQPVTGTKLEVELMPPGGRGMTIYPTVLEARPNSTLRWIGHLGVRGIFDGEHSFRIEPVGVDAVRFVHSERFTGVLVPIVWRFVGEATRQGFIAMNEALKARAEAAA